MIEILQPMGIRKYYSQNHLKNISDCIDESSLTAVFYGLVKPSIDKL